MRWILILIMALLPSAVFAGTSGRAADDMGVDATGSPCLKEKSPAPSFDFERSYTLVLASYSPTSGGDENGGAVLKPCPIEGRDRSGVREDNRTEDPWKDSPELFGY